MSTQATEGNVDMFGTRRCSLTLRLLGADPQSSETKTHKQLYEALYNAMDKLQKSMTRPCAFSITLNLNIKLQLDGQDFTVILGIIPDSTEDNGVSVDHAVELLTTALTNAYAAYMNACMAMERHGKISSTIEFSTTETDL